MASIGPKQGSFAGETEVEAIARIYAQAGSEIQGTLLRLMAAGTDPTPAERRRARRQAEALMARAEKAAERLMTSGAVAAATEGASAVGLRRTRQLNAEARRALQANLAQQVDEIARASVGRAMPYLQAQTALIGRGTDDALRRIGLRATLASMEAERTTRETARDITDRIARLPSSAPEVSDVTGGRLLQVGGKSWQPQAYAQLVARTTTREARTQGFIARAKEEGLDLVTVSEHEGGDIDPICVPYEGETFSLTGATPGYPVLDEAPPFHPNCRHVLTPAEDTTF